VVKNYQELEEMSDVLLTSKANGDFLVYDSATTLWKNKSAATLDLLTATTAASTYLSKAGNLSGLADASVARTNLGLGATDSVTFGSLFKGTVTGDQYSISPNAVWAGKYNGVSVTKTELSDLGVTFPDATVQATKGLIPVLQPFRSGLGFHRQDEPRAGDDGDRDCQQLPHDLGGR